MYCFPNPPKLQSTTARFNFYAVPRQVLLIALAVPTTNALHHMMRREPSNDLSVRAETRPLSITNSCQETIYPGIVTQTGIAPPVGGFQLFPGTSRNFTVSGDWQGRVWGRTNCSFNSAGTGPSSGGYGKACSTGDCGGIIDCKATVGSESRCLRSTAKSVQGEIPVTLAEFTLSSASSQTFYDISLVDGYNIPMAIISLYPESGNSKLTEIPPNLTNPICIGTAALLAEAGSLADANLGTNSSFPIPLDQTLSFDDVQKWCPWDLMLNPPTKPSDGIYPYPDDNLQRPFFNPCFSACAKYNRPLDCCTGKYNSPNICKPSSYSSYAKKVCPDAYSFGKPNDHIRGLHAMLTVN